MCRVLSLATVAVGWDQGWGYDVKPGERIANPQAFGIPTIAFAKYRSFAEVTAMPEKNLLDTFEGLWARLVELTEDETELSSGQAPQPGSGGPSAWSEASDAAWEKSGHMTLSSTIPNFYEKLRREAGEKCGR